MSIKAPTSAPQPAALSWPAPSSVLQLLKPITWFPPMWAYGCGVVSAGVPIVDRWHLLIAGILLAGPMVCGTSQAVNDWYDRHVDAINEPDRPIPSGRVPGRWGLGIAIGWTLVSLAFASMLGWLGLAAAVFGLVCAWMYSAPPFGLTRNGWWGNAAVAVCYEGLPWFTAVALMTAAVPDWRILALAGLYSAGAHGIMTLNDFKAIDGDRRTGIRSLPVQLGPARAARLACVVMAVPQLVVVALLALWGLPLHAAAVGALVLIQVALMPRYLRDPRGRAAWYNATGVTLYVSGMLVSAFGVANVVWSAS